VILKLPGVFEGGAIVTDPVSLIDILPTIGRLLSLDVGERIQGVPLQDVCSGGAQRAGVVAELGRRYRTFRGLAWKLILDRKSGHAELYSLADDPGERRNLAEERPDIRAELLQALQDSRYDRYAPDSVATPELDAGTVSELQALGYVD
jgi:arylsulfatase A-like enzyme